MTELRIGDQAVRCDPEATAAIYASLNGEAERCGCIFCQNFAAQRDDVFPPSFRRLLEQLGIERNKEGEVFEYGPVSDGCHLYGGWFYFVGEMVNAGEAQCSAADGHEFAYFFTSIGPTVAAFRGAPRLTLEFTAHVKWVLPEPPVYRTRAL